MPHAPNINWFVWRPLINDPPLCTLRELQDGTYDVNDLADFNEVIAVLTEARARAQEASEDGR